MSLADFTNARTRDGYKVGVAWQTTKGTKADVADALLVAAEDIAAPYGVVFAENNGTFGTFHKTNTQIEVGRMPMITLLVKAAPTYIPPFLSSYFGHTRALQASSDLTVANDGGSFTSAWVINGVRPNFNTDTSDKLYVSVTDGGSGTGHTVDVYKDLARTAKVLTGTGDDSATIALTESNNSGMTGSVTLGTIAANDVDIELTISQLRTQFQRIPGGDNFGYMTIWLTDGFDTDVYVDCQVKLIKLESADGQMIDMTIEIDAHDILVDNVDTLTGNPSDIDFFHHNTLNLERDPDGSPLRVGVSSFELSLDNVVDKRFAGCDRPIRVIRMGTEIGGGISTFFSAEAKLVLAQALSSSYEKIRVRYVSAIGNWDIVMDQVWWLAEEAQRAGVSGGEENDYDAEFEVRQDVGDLTTELIEIVFPIN